MILNANDIQRRIPHRYPFLLIDRVTDLEPEKSARGLKQVTLGEPVLQGHFPENPVFPGVLILEALGQLAAIACAEDAPDGHPSGEGKYLARIDRARFVKPVLPGDTLELAVEVLKVFGKMVKARGTASVAGDVVASAELTFTKG